MMQTTEDVCFRLAVLTGLSGPSDTERLIVIVLFGTGV